MTLARKLMMAGGGFAQAATDYFAAMSVQPDTPRKALLDGLIKGLQNDGVWSKLDWLTIMAAHDAQAARVNAANPAQIATTGGSPTFTTDRGYIGVSTTGYVNSGWDPATNGVNYLQNSASMGAFCLDNAVDRIMVGSQYGYIAPRVFPSDNITVRANSSTISAVGGDGDSRGLFAWDRSAASAGKIFKNGVEVGTNAISSTSSARTTEDFFICAQNQSGSPAAVDTNRRIAAVFWGGHLTSAEHLALYNRLNTYLTAVGAV